ncbi:MAG: hypothetical protein IT428_05975 [Planctomycetaceae bacterium]|nr:hypothetical protein [Planctomycetaceae bacterium]
MTTATAQQTELRVLSVRQPHAGSFFDARPGRRKFVENRTWQTPHRGQLWIHSSSLDRRPTMAQLDEQFTPDVSAGILQLWDDPASRVTGAIIGCVDLWDIVDFDNLELALMLAPNARAIPKEVKRCLRPSEQDGWLERHLPIRQRLDGIDELQAGVFMSGPFCWLVDNSRLLRKPIPTNGKLNLWKFQADPDMLEFA